MNEEIYNILESCIQDLENGTEIEVILSRYPSHAAELRPILRASQQAKAISAPAPSREAMMRGRARLMQKVAEAREEKSAPKKRIIPFFQRIAISFSLAATLLASGTGLVGASSSALPGQKLYPVKRGWEDIRLFLTFDEDKRQSLEQEIEQERLHEVDELLSEEEHTIVDFSGIFTIRNGLMYVSEVQVILPKNAQLPKEGATVHIIGMTEKGYVEVTRLEILLDTTAAPTEQKNPQPVITKEPKPQNENNATETSGSEGESGENTEGSSTEENSNGSATETPSQGNENENKNNENENKNNNENKGGKGEGEGGGKGGGEGEGGGGGEGNGGGENENNNDFRL